MSGRIGQRSHTLLVKENPIWIPETQLGVRAMSEIYTETNVGSSPLRARGYRQYASAQLTCGSVSCGMVFRLGRFPVVTACVPASTRTFSIDVSSCCAIACTEQISSAAINPDRMIFSMSSLILLSENGSTPLSAKRTPAHARICPDLLQRRHDWAVVTIVIGDA